MELEMAESCGRPIWIYSEKILLKISTISFAHSKSERIIMDFIHIEWKIMKVSAVDRIQFEILIQVFAHCSWCPRLRQRFVARRSNRRCSIVQFNGRWIWAHLQLREMQFRELLESLEFARKDKLFPVNEPEFHIFRSIALWTTNDVHSI